MIADLIKQKLVFTNLNQAKLAELIGTSPSQVGLFLRGEGASLPTKTLEKCFKLLEIDTDVYIRIYESANRVAAILKSRDYEIETILRMPKQDMIDLTNASEISYLIDVKSEEELSEIKKSGLISIESTYPYYKAMVVYLISLGDKVSTRTSATLKQNLWTHIFGATAVTSMIVGGIGSVAAGVVTALGTGILNTINKEGNKPLEALTELAKKIIKI